MKTCGKCGTDNVVNAKYCNNCGFELPLRAMEDSRVKAPVKKKNNKSIAAATIGGVFGSVIAYVVVQMLFFSTESIDSQLAKEASGVNKICPIMIDSETCWVNAVALPSKTFQYTYTLVNAVKDSVDVSALKSILEPNITNVVRTNPDMKSFRDNKVILKYYYQDKNCNHLLTITITPDQYK